MCRIKLGDLSTQKTAIHIIILISFCAGLETLLDFDKIFGVKIRVMVGAKKVV